jgi:hypothetical protein
MDSIATLGIAITTIGLQMRHVLLAMLLLAFGWSSDAQAQDADEHPLPTYNYEISPFTDPSALNEMFPHGLPSLLAPESVATNYRLPAAAPDAKAPTGVQYSEGPLKYEVGTSVKTNTPTASITPSVPDPRVLGASPGGAAGGNGEVKGQVRSADGWELYGTQRFGVIDGERPVAQDSTTFGSAYNLPGPLTGAKIGASLELTPADERKARVEYRQKFGPAEGFIAAEQTFVPDRSPAKEPPPSVRGGVTRKF